MRLFLYAAIYTAVMLARSAIGESWFGWPALPRTLVGFTVSLACAFVTGWCLRPQSEEQR